ncbi:tetratricopeptide repeat protein [Streptomyces sp. So13.3]|uniref:helix-turn-helix domain-containing protein n=1 Tax=Streptomyces TaxID=1883 RepID=UPI001106A6E4|nr:MULTISPECIES: tetratricopeptide repeat protein [Streptomyces]MCZ4101663.1 tetratricopeptide repeat protein [Streptomyces sp. H39-C1]QNA76406.1 tetratricopeptide repeat protein [Streptomyces sp. So13.3]
MPIGGTDDGAPGDAKGIGERVQSLRTGLRLTQRQLAEPKYTPAYVSTVEAGKVRASETALRYFAGKLGTTYEQLATGVPAELRAELREGLAQASGLMDSGSSTDAESLLIGLIEQAQAHQLHDLESQLRVSLGHCMLRRGALAEGRSQFERAESLMADEPLPSRVRAVRGLATAHQLEGDVRYACYLLEKTINELNAEGLPDPEALLLLYVTVITPYMDLGAYERAAKAAGLALDLAPQVKDPVAIAGLHRSVARTLAAQGRYEDAENYLVKAQELYQRREIRSELALCHWMHGYLHTQHGRLAEAEDELRTAREMLRETGGTFYAVQVEVELADVRRRRGHDTDAEQLLLDLLKGLGPGRGAVHAAAAHRLLGLIHEERGDTGGAEQQYLAAIPLQEEADVIGDLADTCRLLGDLLNRQGRTQEAIAVYRRGLTRLARPGTVTLGPVPAFPPLRTLGADSM